MPASRTAFDRSAALEKLRTSSFDVLVIGGGITGAGVALDAAARGLKVALVEREDLASGTSGHSSKLVHGGLRYLQKGELGLVVESLAERRRLLDNAPHLVTPLAFVIPLLGTKGKLDAAMTNAYQSALRSYDLAGGRRIGQAHRQVDAVEVSAHLPFLRTERLMAGLVYWDARTDDARLTLAVARTAAEHGAVVATYVTVTELLTDQRGQVSGARLVADGSSTPWEVSAQVVVNATGVWADRVDALARGSRPGGAAEELEVPAPLAASPVATSPVAAVLASATQAGPAGSNGASQGPTTDGGRTPLRLGDLARRAALVGDTGLTSLARRAGLAAMTASAKVATSTGLAARAGLAAEPERPGRGGMTGLAGLARRTGLEQWISPGAGGPRPAKAPGPAGGTSSAARSSSAAPARNRPPSYAGRLFRTVATGLTSPSSGSPAPGRSGLRGATGPRGEAAGAWVGGGGGRDAAPAAGGQSEVTGRGATAEARGGVAAVARESARRAHLRPAKGIHITVPASRLPCDMAAVLPGPGDKRSIFVIPWGDQVYVGTTDTEYRGSLDEPRATVDDVDYLLRALNASVSQPLSVADITGVWAGLRPLLADGDATLARTADLSRHHRVMVSASGLVTVVGGKLTTYRRMAADTVDVVVRRVNPGRLSRRSRRSPTTALRLWGGAGLAELTGPGAAQRLSTDPATLEHLVGRYGSEAPAVLDLVKANPELGRPMVEGLPFLAAEAVFAARHEMAHTLADILVRRTGALYRDRLATVQAASAVAALVAPELGWDDTEARRQVAQVLATASRDGETAGLPRPARL